MTASGSILFSSNMLKLLSSQKSQIHNFFSCSNSPILDSNRTALLLCPPPPSLHPKLGLTNLINPIVHSLFTRNQLGIVRKEYHRKSFEGRRFSKPLSYSAFLKEVVPSSDHPLFECLEALHRVVVGDDSIAIHPSHSYEVQSGLYLSDSNFGFQFIKKVATLCIFTAKYCQTWRIAIAE